MSILPTEKMYEGLDKFFAEKTILDIDRNTFLICNLKDIPRKITISLVFLRDWDSLESDDFNVVTIKGVGAVFTFPCYWVSVPKELAMEYFKCIIEEFYEKEVSSWGLEDGSGNTGIGSGGNTICPCPPNYTSPSSGNQNTYCPIISNNI